MKRIFINGFNAKSGGGKSILTNYLSILNSTANLSDKYFVLISNKEDYLKYENDNIQIVNIPKIYNKHLLLPITYQFIIPKLLKKLKIDVVFNLADIPIVTTTHQVFLFDWAYAVYPESKVWKMMDIKSLFTRKMKLFFFKRNIRYIDTIIAQTETIKNRLIKFYGNRVVKVVPNAVSLEHTEDNCNYKFNLPKGIKLLYLTYYYSHKNLEILVPIARMIKKENLNYKFIITIDENQHHKAKEFLDMVKKENLEDIIVNIRYVNMTYVPSLFNQCDALFMPTLLESYGLPYVEAMFNEKTILTSNLDFAIDVCSDVAYYFNPIDPIDILKKIKKVFSKEEEKERNRKIEYGKSKINNMLNWNDVIKQYDSILKK